MGWEAGRDGTGPWLSRPGQPIGPTGPGRVLPDWGFQTVLKTRIGILGEKWDLYLETSRLQALAKPGAALFGQTRPFLMFCVFAAGSAPDAFLAKHFGRIRWQTFVFGISQRFLAKLVPSFKLCAHYLPRVCDTHFGHNVWQNSFGRHLRLVELFVADVLAELIWQMFGKPFLILAEMLAKLVWQMFGRREFWQMEDRLLYEEPLPNIRQTSSAKNICQNKRLPKEVCQNICQTSAK